VRRGLEELQEVTAAVNGRRQTRLMTTTPNTSLYRSADCAFFNLLDGIEVLNIRRALGNSEVGSRCYFDRRRLMMDFLQGTVVLAVTAAVAGAAVLLTLKRR
jgi:hypothetical protein